MKQPAFASHVVAVPDFPQKGILFRDLTPVLTHPAAFAECLTLLVEEARKWPGGAVDAVAGIESRGFIFGAPLAQALGVGFLAVRKPGKLPRRTVSASYQKEYGPDTLHLHAEDVVRGQRILVVDDLLATGGTAAAAGSLVAQAGGVVAGFLFVVELDALAGAQRLKETAPVRALLHY